MDKNKNNRLSIGFPPAIRDLIKEQVGQLGNSESEVVKTIVIIYFVKTGSLTLKKEK